MLHGNDEVPVPRTREGCLEVPALTDAQGHQRRYAEEAGAIASRRSRSSLIRCLKEQAHEEEKRILQRTLEHKVEESRTLADRSADLLGNGVDTFDMAIAEIEGIKNDLVFALCSNGWPSPCMSSTIGNCASTSSRRCRRQSVPN